MAGTWRPRRQDRAKDSIPPPYCFLHAFTATSNIYRPHDPHQPPHVVEGVWTKIKRCKCEMKLMKAYLSLSFTFVPKLFPGKNQGEGFRL